MFFGWWIVSGAVTMQALIAGLFLQAYGVYAAFWMVEFGWTRTTVSLAYSLHRTESALLGPLHGWLLQRFSPRGVILVGLVMLGGGFMGIAGIQTFGQFIAAYLLMAVGASLAGILSLTTVIVNWFERRRARAMSLLAVGLSLGGLAIPLVSLLMVAYGWRTVAFASGVLILVVGLPLSRLMHRDPEGLGLRPDGARPVASEPRGERSTGTSMAVRAALRTRTFWLLSLGHSTGIAVVSAVLVHFVIYLQAFGLSVTAAASLLTLTTVLSMVGQLLAGVIGDRVPKRLLAGAGMLGHAAAVLLLAFAPSIAVIVVACILHGLSWGVRGPLMSAMRADYFGRASYSMIMGTSSLIVMLGSVAGPLVAGALADAHGAYGGAYVALSLIALLGAAAFFALRPPRPADPPAVPYLQEADR